MKKALLKNWKRNLFDFVLIIGFFVLIMLLCNHLISFDKDINLTITSIEARLNPLYYSDYKVTCGEWAGNVDVEKLSNLLLIDNWHETSPHSHEENCYMTVVFGEEWELTIYESYAVIYYGFTSIGASNMAYYSIPSEVVSNIEDFRLEVAE